MDSISSRVIGHLTGKQKASLNTMSKVLLRLLSLLTVPTLKFLWQNPVHNTTEPRPPTVTLSWKSCWRPFLLPPKEKVPQQTRMGHFADHVMCYRLRERIAQRHRFCNSLSRYRLHPDGPSCNEGAEAECIGNASSERSDYILDSRTALRHIWRRTRPWPGSPAPAHAGVGALARPLVPAGH